MLTPSFLSYISTMHHLGTILVAQSAIAISLNLSREKDATIEFILCLVWGKSGPIAIIRTQTSFCSLDEL